MNAPEGQTREIKTGNTRGGGEKSYKGPEKVLKGTRILSIRNVIHISCPFTREESLDRAFSWITLKVHNEMQMVSAQILMVVKYKEL